MKREKKTPLFTKNYILLILTAFIGGFLMTLFTSTLPLYAERLTGSSVYAGLVTTVFTIAALATRPVTGIACEKNKHVPIMIIGFVIMVLACFFYGWTGAIVMFLIVRALHGIGFGIKTTVSGVLVAENIPKARFAEGIGIYNLYLPLTNALGPAIAYYIIGDGAVENFRPLFILGTVLGCCAVVMSFFIKEKNGNLSGNEEDETAEEIDSADLPPVFLGFEKGAIAPAVVLAMMYVGQGTILSFIALYSIDSGIGDVGKFFVINAAVLFVARFFFAKCVSRVGYDKPSIAGLLLFAVGLFIIPFSESITTLYIASAFLGIAQGIVPMSLNAIILERCSPQRSGTAMAAYTSAMDIGVGAGSIILGAILEATNYLCIFSLAAAISLAAMGVYCMTLNGKRKNIDFEQFKKKN